MKEEIVTYRDLKGHEKQIMLPIGVRAADLKYLNDEDIDVLCLLKVEGRKTRNYFASRHQIDVIKRLKTRGLVVSVRQGSGYAYDLSSFAYKAFELHLI